MDSQWNVKWSYFLQSIGKPVVLYVLCGSRLLLSILEEQKKHKKTSAKPLEDWSLDVFAAVCCLSTRPKFSRQRILKILEWHANFLCCYGTTLIGRVT